MHGFSDKHTHKLTHPASLKTYHCWSLTSGLLFSQKKKKKKKKGKEEEEREREREREREEEEEEEENKTSGLLLYLL